MDTNNTTQDIVTLIEAISQCRMSDWERGFLFHCCHELSKEKKLPEKEMQWVQAIHQRKVRKGFIKEGRTA